ncbi:hypothetical protein [Pedobacter frigidisoli]|uniref:hypothetical protein n=1 Tax=Pedobacter frigidisoli TaxID=2530455 RepID=UPI002930FDFE|nr:hypothetical protein [Pedobacter frigidisoli]
MNTNTRIIRNSAICLIAFGIISIVINLIGSFIDYSDQSLIFSVRLASSLQSENIGGLDFTNSGVGKIEIKPTLVQSIVLGNSMYEDGGGTIIFYMISCFSILWVTKNKNVELEDFTEKNLGRLIFIGMFCFLVPKVLIKLLLDRYVGDLTQGRFVFFDQSGPFSNGGYGVIIIFNIIYGLLEYAKKLKKEVDLTI